MKPWQKLVAALGALLVAFIAFIFIGALAIDPKLELGVEKPRLKVLPVFLLGAEVERSGAYASWQRLRASDALDDRWDHLQCSSCRMVTDQGVWVCPILVNEPSARMGERLVDSLGPFELRHSACWTCHVDGVSCRT